MRNIWTIARREYRHYFISPIAYVAALVTLLVVGIVFVVNIYYLATQSYYGSMAPDVGMILAPMSTIFLLTTPALTMRLLADEQRTGTLELILTAPVRDWELVIGKWLGAFLFTLSIIAVTLVYPLVLNGMVTPGIDQGLLISGYLAIILATSVFLAVGTAMSSMFSNQFAAFFATLVIILVLWWLIGFPAYITSGNFSNIFNYLDMNSRFNAMLGGTITLSDVIYPLSLTSLGLLLGTVAVEMRRWR